MKASGASRPDLQEAADALDELAHDLLVASALASDSIGTRWPDLGEFLRGLGADLLGQALGDFKLREPASSAS